MAAWKTSRPFGFVLIAAVYAAAAAIGFAVYAGTGGATWLRLLVADLAATLAVWAASTAVGNASVYDPYWSVAPPVVLTAALVANGRFDAGSLALVALVDAWGLRLTANWAVTFRGLGTQDWRYDRIRERTGPWWPLANLAGIQAMPTLVVFTCLLPAFVFLERGGSVGPIGIAGLAVLVLGLALETVADLQQHAFRRRAGDRTRINDEGLWRHSRHPNYLGEILVWWGVAGVHAAAFPTSWWLGFGAVVNTTLFLFISIPMAERRLAEYKSGYEGHAARTRRLLPLPRFRGDRAALAEEDAQYKF